jgi:cyclopropane-fatty-acyl-phospholipid synthase
MLQSLLKQRFKVGRLTVAFDGGAPQTYGDGTGPEVVVSLSSAGARRIAMNPSLGLGEAYMECELVLEKGSLWDLMEMVGRNYSTEPQRSGAFKRFVQHIQKARQQLNDRSRARRNVHHHYDIGNDLYRAFLDEDMQYSCAYFPRLDMTLEEAQRAKKTHIAAKLNLQPGMTVLDIGCGWGGLGLELARNWGATVHGVTLSTEQLTVANQRAEAEGLTDRAKFTLTDYRDIKGQYDRIVSVGMFEHVGVPNYPAFFETVRKLLKPDGCAVIHSIGRSKGPGVTDAFTDRYIFPGGYIPALSEVLPAVEQAGLWTTDVEILRLHYAETIKHWHARFMARWDEMAKLYDERFCRMWDYYLAGAQLAFRYGGHMNFQIQLARRVDALPITRDYMIEAERSASGAGPRLTPRLAAHA